MMSDLLWQGLQISVLGLGLTFTALGLLVLTMMALERLFRPRPPAPESTTPKPRRETETVAESTDEEEVVAAITAALAHFRAQDGGQPADLGAELEAGPGAWWQAGRLRRPTIAPRTKQWRNKHESEEKSKGNG